MPSGSARRSWRGEGKPYGPFAEALMFSAARLDHLAQTIRPALARGDIVLCDRFSDSTRAYQGALGRDRRWRNSPRWERVVIGETRPDLSASSSEICRQRPGLARANARRGSPRSGKADRFEAEKSEFSQNGFTRGFSGACQGGNSCLFFIFPRSAIG